MSGEEGEFDDLLAAFNIPTADGQNAKPKQTSPATDLTSPKKLALNGNASTCEVADIESEDDEGWIIDESDSSEVKKSEEQVGQKNDAESVNDKLIKGRRKQIFPKLNADTPVIGSSFTPMQGWKAIGNTTQKHVDGQKDNLISPSLQPSKDLQLTHTSTLGETDNNHTVTSSSIPMHSSTPIPSPSDEIMMPVIDPTSVVSKAVTQPIILKPVSTNIPATHVRIKPKMDIEIIGPQFVSKVIDFGNLSSNIYKPSVPIFAHREYDAPAGGYPCTACGSYFLSEGSLLAHLKRPSVIIKYACIICCYQCQFYNKCSLWTHLLSHSKDAFKNIDIFTKTINIKPFTRKEFLSYNFGAKCVLTLQDYNQVVRVKCPGCSKKFQESVSYHLGQLDTATMSECPTCKRVLKNSCEKQLHQIMHADGRYCPGCGIEHINLMDYFQHCKSFSCLYWLSFPLLVCWICCISYYSLDLFMKHLCDQHSLSYYKCAHCQLAFRNFDALNLHMTKDHPAIKQLPKPYHRRILKCPLCKNVFSTLEAILTHLKSTHSCYIFETVKKICYRCSICPHSRNFVDRLGLLTHIKIAHKGYGIPAVCDLCGKVVSSVAGLQVHRTTCLRESKRAVKEVISISPAEQKISTPSSSTRTTKRVLQCSKCPSSRRVFYSTVAGYRNHYRSTHSGMTPVPVEVDLVTAGLNLSNIRSNMPVTKSNDSTVKPAQPIATGSSKRPIADTNACQDEMESKKIKAAPQALLSCVKCGFNSVDRGEFSAHIKSHKGNSSHEQCQECGLCFRSQMAVTRHMAMKHMIQTPVAAVVMPLSSPIVRSPVKAKSPKEEVGSSKVIPTPKTKCEDATLECTVCYRLFSTDALLRNHMRTHGMAFIRSKRSTVVKS